MTLSATSRKVGPFTGTGALLVCPFAFKAFAASEVTVVGYINGAEWNPVYNSDYTVALNSNQETSPGGKVSITAPYGAKLYVLGNTALTQDCDIPGGGNFNPTALEQQLDRIVMQLQEMSEVLSRTVQGPIASTVTTITDLAPQSATYTGDGTTLTYAVGANAIGIQVYIDGLHQTLGIDYSVSGTSILFAEAPASSTSISIDYWLAGLA